jgi:TATA-binding protein-associated factor Taf7
MVVAFQGGRRDFARQRQMEEFIEFTNHSTENEEVVEEEHEDEEEDEDENEEIRRHSFLECWLMRSV